MNVINSLNIPGNTLILYNLLYSIHWSPLYGPQIKELKLSLMGNTAFLVMVLSNGIQFPVVRQVHCLPFLPERTILTALTINALFLLDKFGALIYYVTACLFCNCWLQFQINCGFPMSVNLCGTLYCWQAACIRKNREILENTWEKPHPPRIFVYECVCFWHEWN